MSLAADHHLLALPFEGRVLIPQFAGTDDVTVREPLGISAVLDEELAEDCIVGITGIAFDAELILYEISVSLMGDVDFAHHLADNDLEVLVVDLHTLETVDRLNLVDDIFLSLDRSENIQDVGR